MWKVSNAWQLRQRAALKTARGRELAQKAVVIVEETDAAFFAALGERTARLVQHFGVLVKSDAAKG